MTLIAVGAIASGVLVLLGWFTLPVRVVVLAILAALAWRSFKPRCFDRDPDTASSGPQAPSFKQSFRSACSLRLVACSSAAFAATLILWSSGTTDPIRSPWSVVPAPFFLLYALLAMMMVVSTVRSSLLPSSFFLLPSSLVAILVYPIGFGFDHFIHAAAERIIATTGALSPTPLFYSAHYGLTVLLADLLPWVDVALADRLLVPLVVLLLIPLAVRALRTVLSERAAILGAGSLLIVPFLPLAVSTPQALANVFTVAVVFALLAKDMRSAALIAIAAALAQPMTGIIAIAVVAIAFTWQRGWRVIGAIMAALGAAGIPFAFAIASRIVPQLDVVISFAPLAALQRLGSALRDAFAFTAADFATADALMIARILLPMLWITLAIIGAWTQRDRTLTLAPLIALVAAVLVAATVTIPTQLGEEQSQFPLRLVQLAALLAIPLAGIGLGTILERVRGRLPTAAVTVTFGILATFTLLLAYPRDDAQERSGLWSVSASDIAAVHAISEDAGDTPYVVLANQMLGAAAIREFGFRPSYVVCMDPSSISKICNLKSEILAFPLPAGGPIARQFWNYVSQPPLSPISTIVEIGDTRRPIDVAMDLVGAQRAYVVLHDYWRNYAHTVAATAAIANAELESIPHLRIFRFERRPPPLTPS